MTVLPRFVASLSQDDPEGDIRITVPFMSPN
jgi:hypothetical protein